MMSTQHKRVAISIVSHVQGKMVQTLLADLVRLVDASIEVLVTLNIPEPEDFLAQSPVPVQVIRNTLPMGFGANHNQALLRSQADFFLVMNPDVRLRDLDLEILVRTLDDEALAACSPLVLNPSGRIEDNARFFPRPSLILKRVLTRLLGRATTADYPLQDSGITRVNWIAGMCIMFNAHRYREVAGFDARYFMYLEDADICRRLSLRGYAVAVNSDTRVVHDARRATMKNAKHLRWHAKSMARFFVGSLSLNLRRRLRWSVRSDPK